MFNYLSYFLSALFVVFITILTWFIVNVKKYRDWFGGISIMERKIVHVVGTGTIGEPLIGILCEQKSNLGIDEVTFHKQSPLTKDAPKIKNLIAKGARLAVHEERVESFKKIGLEPEFTMEEAVSRSSVVIDCTPKGFGHKNKLDYYE